jgi:hypothetical protein
MQCNISMPNAQVWRPKSAYQSDHAASVASDHALAARRGEGLKIT